MRIKLIIGDERDEGTKSIYLAAARAMVREWVASDAHGKIDEWPALLALIAEISDGVPDDQKFPQHVTDAIEAMSEEAVATLAALTGAMGCRMGMDAEQMVTTHHLEGDAVTGTAIAGFMMHRRLSGAESHLLAHLISTLDTGQRASLVCMAVAFLAVFGFTPDDILALDYPGKVVAP